MVMATALGAQLAQIRAQSTNSLDLKAQKKAHSKSLLFDSRNAATQDFESIYQICHEGFEELCRLDPRFAQFASNIFSEQSKQEDRTQMTAAQSQQLDGVIEAFLGLVGSRILLRPAIKAVEWLVRRFRIHENNTSNLVLTFLPYHATAMFTTVLSILPQTLPPTLKFLHPYVQSLANPPRHTIVYTASHSRPFFSTLSTHMLKISRMGYQYSTLTSFWASIATEAVAAMLDNARSTRQELQKQNQEDVILSLLPILNEGLSSDIVPDLRVGCYMVLTVLASKVNLGDGVVTAMMKAVISGWNQTSHAGLICLSVLAQQRENAELPEKVFKAILALERLDDDLSILSNQYKVDKLVLGVVLGIISRIHSAQDASRLRLVRILMEAHLMDEASTIVAIRAMLSTAQIMTSDTTSTLDVRGAMADLLLHLADSNSIGNVVQTTVERSRHDIGQFGIGLQRVLQDTESSPERMMEDVDMGGTGSQVRVEDFDALTSWIPAKTAYEMSYLSHSDSYVFNSLAHVFSSISASDMNVEKFSGLPVLRKPFATREPLFLSFFVRLWCSDSPTNARTAAIQTVSGYIEEGPLKADVQMLLPYLIYALGDPSPKVRRAAAELLLSLERAYTEAEKDKSHANIPILGHEQIYGQGKETEGLPWLSRSEIRTFMTSLLVPGVEECLVDRDHISQLLSDSLNGSKHSGGFKNTHKGLKTSLRLAIFGFLGSHVVNTPLYTVKHRLLQTLNRVTKVNGTSRTTLLLPLLSHCAKQTQDEHDRKCRREQLNPLPFLDHVVDIVIPTDRDGIQTLNSLIESEVRISFPSLRTAALHRIRAIWPSIRSDLQTSIASTLLEQTLMKAETEANGDFESETMETLRALPLSTTILKLFVEGLPSIASALQDPPLASKRRRTGHGHSIEPAPDPRSPSVMIKHIILVLELVEHGRAERHPELLKGLFEVMSDLQHSQSHAKAVTDYLLVLTIDSTLAIVKRAEGSNDLKIDNSAIRSDVLIDCVRTTTSPQVRNTALLLVSALAIVAPELVLHSVMPIFTFMGVNLLRQDDDFSAHVVKQAMESVIPRLVQSLLKRKDGPFIGVSELLLSFAASYEHIPTQRRLDLFTSLVDKVGSSEYLFALLAIFMDKYSNDQGVLQFAVDLMSHYDVKVRLRTMERYLGVILDARKPKPTFSASLLMTNNDVNVESTAVNMLQLPTVILGDQNLVSKLAKKLNKGDEDAAMIRSSYAQMLEEIFLLAEQSKGSRKLDVSCMRVLDASLGLMPIREMIDTLQHLLEHTDDSIRRQVLRSFECRLSGVKMHQKATQTACFAFLPRLLSMIKESRDTPLKHIAVSCVDKISEKFGKNGVPAVIDAAQTVSMDLCLGSGVGTLRVASLICLATMVEVIGEAFISIVPNAFARAMDNLADSIQEDTDGANPHNAVYTFLSALLLYLPWVITGAYLDLLLKMSYQSANAEMGEGCDQRRVEALQLVPRKVEAKVCFAALKRTWADAVSAGPLAVREYLGILGLAMNHYPKSVIVKQSETLGDLLLRVFDLRRVQLSPLTEDSYTVDEIAEAEDGVNESAIAMVYKLNDAKFRPLFSKMLEWTSLSDLNLDKATDTKAVLHRQATWYRFLLKFFDTLKSIVTTYAGFIIEDSVKILKDSLPKDEDSMFLWRQVILTLHKTFEHDQDGFYQSPSHFGPIFAALLSQLANAAQVPLLPELIPAIAELAVAADSADHHKEMNTAILPYMRSDSPAVRLAAIQCERALTQRLGEEWLGLLPEILPFINEGMEDDDEGVEREVQRWKADIEGILGESLDPMLQ